MGKKLTEEQKAARKATRDANQRKKDEAYRLRLIEAEIENKRREIAMHPERIPTIQFEVGDRVTYGRHHKTEILEVFDNYTFYHIRNFGQHSVYGNLEDYEDFQYVFWHQLEPLRTKEKDDKISSFKQEERIRLSYYQSDISALIHCYYSGVDTNPDYQRGNVWNDDDKKSLLDSIFNNIDIGKFSFIKLDYDYARKYYLLEILDGKQRLLTLVDFFENRFKYNGRYFKDLSWKDQRHFRGYSISYGETRDIPTQTDRYEYFLKLNTGGKPVAESHLNKVREMWKNAKKESK